MNDRPCQKIYAAWVRRIEIALSTWADDSSEIETPILARFPLKIKSSSRKDYLKDKDQVWWCAVYNRQRCSFGSSTHQKNVKCHLRKVRHIYAVLVIEQINQSLSIRSPRLLVHTT